MPNNIQKLVDRRITSMDNIIYQHVHGLEYEVNGNGIVTLLKKQDFLIQKVLRKVKFKIPEYSKITLDQMGSQVFLLINGNRSVKDIASIIEQSNDFEKGVLIQNLNLFLDHLEVNLRCIQKV